MKPGLTSRALALALLPFVAPGCGDDASPRPPYALDPAALTGTARYIVVNDTDYQFGELMITFMDSDGYGVGPIGPGALIELSKVDHNDFVKVLQAPPSAALSTIALIDPVGAISYLELPVTDAPWHVEPSDDGEHEWKFTLRITAQDVIYDNPGMCCCEGLPHDPRSPRRDELDLVTEATCGDAGGECIFAIGWRGCI